MKYTKLLSVAAAVLMVSMSFAASSGSSGDGKVDQELTLFNDRFNSIAESYDINAFLALYIDNPLWIAPEQPPVSGHDVPKATFEFFASNEGSLTHTVDHIHASTDGTLATMIGQYELAVEKVGVTATGTYQFVLRRTEGEWKIISDMYNQHKK